MASEYLQFTMYSIACNVNQIAIRVYDIDAASNNTSVAASTDWQAAFVQGPVS